MSELLIAIPMSSVFARFSEDSENLMENAQLVCDKKGEVVTLLGECPICLCPVEAACSLRKLPCGHMFCLKCCVNHILARLAVGVSTGRYSYIYDQVE